MRHFKLRGLTSNLVHPGYFKYRDTQIWGSDTFIVEIRVGIGSGHSGHVLSGSLGSDPVYKTSRCDLDSALDHMC